MKNDWNCLIQAVIWVGLIVTAQYINDHSPSYKFNDPFPWYDNTQRHAKIMRDIGEWADEHSIGVSESTKARFPEFKPNPRHR